MVSFLSVRARGPRLREVCGQSAVFAAGFSYCSPSRPPPEFGSSARAVGRSGWGVPHVRVSRRDAQPLRCCGQRASGARPAAAPGRGFCEGGSVSRSFLLSSRLSAQGLGNRNLDSSYSGKKIIVFITLSHLLGVMWRCVPSGSFRADETHVRGFPGSLLRMAVPGRGVWFGWLLMFEEST